MGLLLPESTCAARDKRMKSDLDKHPDFVEAALLLAANATGELPKMLILPDPLVLKNGSEEDTRITTVATNIMALNPKANHIAYITSSPTAAILETYKTVDEDWYCAISRIIEHPPTVKGKQQFALSVLTGFYPFLEQLERAYRSYAWEGTGVCRTTKEFVEILSIDELVGRIAVDDPLAAKEFDFESVCKNGIKESDAQNITHGILYTGQGKEFAFDHKVLHHYCTYILDASGVSKEELIATYFFIRFIESIQNIKHYKSIQRVPLIINAEENTLDPVFRELHRRIYDLGNIGDGWVLPFLQREDKQFSNMDFGEEIVHIYRKIIALRTKPKEEKKMKGLWYGSRPFRKE